jgi:hypothetical protein
VRDPAGLEITTTRGAIRISPEVPLAGIAWDGLSADGETWSHALAFCVEHPPSANTPIAALGADAGADVPEDRRFGFDRRAD